MNKAQLAAGAVLAALATTAAYISPVHAQQQGSGSGEIRRISPQDGKITIAHGEISGLGLPAMSLVYHVKNPALLKGLKPGDKVKFTARRENGNYVITEISK
jgi:Cu/Ag efflux protein CusF